MSLEACNSVSVAGSMTTGRPGRLLTLHVCFGGLPVAAMQQLNFNQQTGSGSDVHTTDKMTSSVGSQRC